MSATAKWFRLGRQTLEETRTDTHANAHSLPLFLVHIVHANTHMLDDEKLTSGAMKLMCSALADCPAGELLQPRYTLNWGKSDQILKFPAVNLTPPPPTKRMHTHA